MMEIAISLAVIGIALVAIIGVLPIGMNVQQANREETIIGQDANVLMESIRNASLGNDDLTNYIYAISNYWTQFNVNGSTKTGVNGYTYGNAFNASGYPSLGYPLTNAANIIGLLSTPEYIGAGNGGRGISSGTGSSADVGGDVPGQPIPNIMYGGISNHIVAYCYSVSGPAIQKPPQDNPILQQDSFGYHVYCVNAPMPIDTNLFSPLWTAGTYSGPLTIPVFYNWTYWNLLTNSSTVPYGNLAPGNPPWVMSPNYTLEQALNLHEVRLTFEWPALAKGNVGPSRETFRTMVAGQLLHQPQLVFNLFGAPANSIWYNANLYCYLPETFTNTP